MATVSRIKIKRFGPIRDADLKLGNLTVLVGPQATGKSVFLQLLKLLLDKRPIHDELRHSGIEWNHNPKTFLNLYFGEGMASIWKKNSRISLGEGNGPVELESYTQCRAYKRTGKEKAFYIPAQRVMSIRDGMTRPFTDYKIGDPFVLRKFSDQIHQLVQNEFGLNKGLFPQKNRLYAELREPLEKHVFGGFELRTDSSKYQSYLTLKRGSSQSLPYLVWSAGQREFVPMLLGLYWLLPPGRVSRRNDLEWVVLEEPEMGLHPDGIGAVLNLVLELLHRGYRVCLSTHSPQVLDIVWALKLFQKYQARRQDVRRLFSLKSTVHTRQLADTALSKKLKLKTYYFARDASVQDISDLDPSNTDAAEAGWGGLTEFSGKAGEIVAEVVSRNGKE